MKQNLQLNAGALHQPGHVEDVKLWCKNCFPAAASVSHDKTMAACSSNNSKLVPIGQWISVLDPPSHAKRFFPLTSKDTLGHKGT